MKVKPVLETDLQFMLDRLMNIARIHGRSQGFMIGVFVANVVNFVLDIAFKH